MIIIKVQLLKNYKKQRTTGQNNLKFHLDIYIHEEGGKRIIKEKIVQNLSIDGAEVIICKIKTVPCAPHIVFVIKTRGS